jgi:hypothetical protein
MSCLVRAALLILCLSLCAGAQNRTLALYLSSDGGLNPESVAAMHSELERVLAPVGIDLVWRTLGEQKLEDNFDLLAVNSFEGACSLEAEWAQPAVSGGTTILADTAISDGTILPFFHVDCPQLIGIMKSELERLDVRARQVMLGRALARVMAHEIYHIVAGTAEHQNAGVAKAAFSVGDLTGARSEFDRSSIARMRPIAIGNLVPAL